jgi:hypothetical protein
MLIDTPLLIVGHGPAPLVVAKVAAGCGAACLLAGHEPVEDRQPVPLSAEAVATLEHHGLFDVLRPYLDTASPPTIAPLVFEEVIKHHCVADLNVTVYDRMTVVDAVPAGPGLRGVLPDGTGRWDVRADVFVDGGLLPRDLCSAIIEGVAAALEALHTPRSTTSAGGGTPLGVIQAIDAPGGAGEQRRPLGGRDV